MPKLPPPPRKPQNRSAFSFALARTTSPAAVTTVAASKLSIDSPILRSVRPTPPPNVNPPAPVCETMPVVVIILCAVAAVSMCPSNDPPSARSVIASASTSVECICDRSIIMPPSEVDLPGRLWPPHFTDTSKLRSRAKLTALTTSSTAAHCTTIAGCLWSNMPFQTCLAAA